MTLFPCPVTDARACRERCEALFRGDAQPKRTASETGTAVENCRGVAQPGRAPALGAGGREFESHRPDQFKINGLACVPALHSDKPWQGLFRNASRFLLQGGLALVRDACRRLGVLRRLSDTSILSTAVGSSSGPPSRGFASAPGERRDAALRGVASAISCPSVLVAHLRANGRLFLRIDPPDPGYIGIIWWQFGGPPENVPVGDAMVGVPFSYSSLQDPARSRWSSSPLIVRPGCGGSMPSARCTPLFTTMSCRRRSISASIYDQNCTRSRAA